MTPTTRTVGSDAARGAGAFNPLAAQVPLWLPMGFVATALAAGWLLLVGLAIAWGQFASVDGGAPLWTDLDAVRLQPPLLAGVHLFTLLFGSAVTIGVLYQMAPVILVTKLHSPLIGWASLAAFVPGGVLVVGSFYKFHIPGLICGAIAVAAGGLLFVYNMWHTGRSSPEGSITRRFLLPAVASFLLTLIFGLLAAAKWRFGGHLFPANVQLLRAHLFVGVGGWFTGIVVGVSYVLIPMFRLVHGHDEAAGRVILKLLYGGVALGAFAPFVGGAGGWPVAQDAMTGGGLLLVAGAVALYGRDFYTLWRRGLRSPDVWLAQIPWAVAYLVVAAGGAVVVYGLGRFGIVTPVGVVLALAGLYALGFIATMILALLHKIVPFLVWYHRYVHRIGTTSVPLMKDLVDEGRGSIGFIAYHSGLVMAVVAMAANIPAAVQGALALMAMAFAWLASDLVQLLLPRRKGASPSMSPPGSAPGPASKGSSGPPPSKVPEPPSPQGEGVISHVESR